MTANAKAMGVGGGGRVRALWVVASSDELNNKRCKYDNFSQDVASNNKIKIIPRQRQKSPSQVSAWRKKWAEGRVVWMAWIAEMGWVVCQ